MYHLMASERILRHHGLPESSWTDSLSADDLNFFRASKGDPAVWQAEWKLLAVLISLHVFRNVPIAERTLQALQDANRGVNRENKIPREVCSLGRVRGVRRIPCR